MARKSRFSQYVKPLRKPVDFGKVMVDPHILRDMWWLLVVLAAALVAFGMFALVWPSITLFVLATVFGIFVLTHGFVELVTGARSIGHNHVWFLKALLGTLEIVAGVY